MTSSPTEAAKAAVVEVPMPQVGVSIAEATVVSWRVEAGDRVEVDQVLCDTESDKVDVEIPSPVAGVVEDLVAAAGETVTVGETICRVRPEGPPEAGNGAGAADGGSADASGRARPGPSGPDRSSFLSPVVQRIAERERIDLGEVEGTGIGGRIRKADLIAHLRSRRAHVPPAEAVPSGSPAPGPAPPEDGPVLHTASPYREEGTDAGPAPDGTPAPRRVEMTAVRRRIAERMLESRRTSAHCTTVIEVDMGEVLARREAMRAALADRGVPLTPLAFLCHATAAALLEHPRLNASVEGTEILEHRHVDMGIAVALDDGLIVPVLRRSERLSLEGIAAGISDLAERARTGRLAPDEVRGGTFTVTNPGRFGTLVATPIINQPQVAILALEGIAKRPVCVETEAGDSLAFRPIAHLCLSWDHRVLDGMQAARFLADVRDRLERREVTR